MTDSEAVGNAGTSDQWTKKGGHFMDDKLPHTKRISEMLDRRRRKEAIELHNAYVAKEIDRAKGGDVINLSDLMPAKEVLLTGDDDRRSQDE